MLHAAVAESIPKTAWLVGIFTSISDNLAQFAGLRVVSQRINQLLTKTADPTIQ